MSRPRHRSLGAVAAAIALAACATAPPSSAPGAIALGALPGWAAEDHIAALSLVARICARAARPSRACDEARTAGPRDEAASRTFLESRYLAVPVAGEGRLTGYFAPEYPARAASDGAFTAPLRPAPADPAAAGERLAIERRPAPDALAWMRPEDLFSLQTQGSGVLVFADGSRRRAAFAGSNGAVYVAIAGQMAARGLLSAADTSAGAVRAWLAAHRGPQAEAVMGLDPRYVFFRLAPDDGGAPVGSAGATLIAGRSLAVDPEFHRPFELIWIDAETPALPGAHAAYRRLGAAMDAGAAIKGPVRADLYVGEGPAAGEEAGRIRHDLRLWRLVPAR